MEDRPVRGGPVWENKTAPAPRRGDKENQSVRSLATCDFNCDTQAVNQLFNQQICDRLEITAAMAA
jgi:hypothetical protein